MRINKRTFPISITGFAILMALTQYSQAQLTQLSSNTDLSGFVTSNGSTCIMTDYNSALWTTDGTAAGTKTFTDKVAAYFYYSLFTEYNGTVIFAGYNATTGYSLWKTDGTDAGTELIKQINSNVSDLTHPPYMFVQFNGKVYFFAWSTATGYELWATDGTTAGTSMIKDINPGSAGSVPGWNDGDYYAFFTTDSSFSSAHNNYLLFYATDGSHGNELWKTDGTSAGTVMLKDINPGSASSDPSNINTLSNGTTVFVADDGVHGRELWKTDGTADSTTLVLDIYDGFSSSGIEGNFRFKGKIYFRCFDNVHGVELWSTDGTTTGTTLLKDFIPGISSSYPLPWQAITFSNKFIIPASRDAINGLTDLWVSDGTTAGTSILSNSFNDYQPLPDYYDKNTSQVLVNHNPAFSGKTFLWASGTNSSSLYTYDGNNFVHVFDYAQRQSSFYGLDGLYFDGSKTDSIEYYKSDGTTSGTIRIDAIPVLASKIYSTQYRFVYNGSLYISNDNGDNISGYTDLYKTPSSILALNNILLAAQLKDNTSTLSWLVNDATGINRFVVERSTDGIHFNSIGSVNTINRQNNYTFVDNIANIASEKIYYRIKATQTNGKTMYSGISVINVAQELNAWLTPNPAYNTLVAHISANTQSPYTLRIFNASGATVLQITKLLQQGNNAINIDVSSLAPGNYILLVTGGEKIMSFKWVKK